MLLRPSQHVVSLEEQIPFPPSLLDRFKGPQGALGRAGFHFGMGNGWLECNYIVSFWGVARPIFRGELLLLVSGSVII